FTFNAPTTSDICTLSLHDALPIYDGESEVTAGTSFLTLRSDNMDKYAQPDGHILGKPGTPTGVSFEGPALKGATKMWPSGCAYRSEEHTSELQSRGHLVCRLLLEK